MLILFLQLVASSTVGVAATGLAFGQPQTPSHDRPASHKRKPINYDAHYMTYSSPPTRPVTSSDPPVASHPVLSPSKGDYFSRFPAQTHNQAGSPPIPGSRVGSGRHADTIEQLAEERHSISSKSSWMRRLSYIGTSQHGSPRSSVGPDSPSITFSHGSAAPILHNGSNSGHQEPNKLVKRASSIRGVNGHGFSNPTSSQRLPTLRRPATSHQRSITLQQQYHDAEMSQPRTPTEANNEFPIMQEFSPLQQSSWRPYLESCPTRLAKERHASTGADMVREGFYSTSKRVLVPDGVLPTLLKPSMVDNPAQHGVKTRARGRSSTVGAEGSSRYPQFQRQPEIVEEEPEKKPRQSLSQHFSSPTSWMNKTGSLRIKKGRDTENGPLKRILSVSLSSSPPSKATTTQANSEHINGLRKQLSDIADNREVHVNHPEPSTPNNRKETSTLRTMSRLSSFNVEYGSTMRSVSNGTASKAVFSETPSQDGQILSRTADGRSRALSSHPVVLHQSFSLHPIEVNNSDQGSAFIGSDSDLKGFAAVEDEEIDFHSDTAYDSFRTGATASLRARSTALDSMFDESPPSSGSRTKLADFHDGVLFTSFHSHENNIIREEEDMVTPVKNRRQFEDDVRRTPTGGIAEFGEETLRSSPPAFALQPPETRRLSSGDDDESDEDWTKDDDDQTLTNALSPPSNSTSSQRAGQALRGTLAGKPASTALARMPSRRIAFGAFSIGRKLLCMRS